MMRQAPILEVKGLCNRFGAEVIHEGVNVSINKGEIIAIVGGSGSGKTLLLRSILKLHIPNSGEIRLFDQDVYTASHEMVQMIRRRIGVSFQYNALFSSLNSLENVRFPLDEFTQLSKAEKNKIALTKLQMAGLEIDVAHKFPDQISGGMQKRVSVARALALEPDILFLDEPTSGLDPVSSRKFDNLVQNLRNMLGLTIVMVTHDKQSLPMADRIIFLGDKKVLANVPYTQLIQIQHPLIQDYFAKELVGGK